MISSVIGLGLTLVIIFCSITVGVDSVKSFVFFPSLIIIVGIALGLSLLSFSVRELLSAFSSLRVLISVPTDCTVHRQNAKVHRCLISYLYAGGALASLIAFIQMAYNVTDIKDIVPGLGVIALGFFYAVFLSECFLRPAAHKIESKSLQYNDYNSIS